MNDSIAVIGAGMAGLGCATRLAAAGRTVRLFDKGRRPSGRMAGRVVAVDGRDFAFDYGAHYMTARDPAFVAQLDAWRRSGVVARWPAAGADAWVGTPAMDAPLAAMAAALDVRWSCHVRSVVREQDGWRVRHDAGEDGPFGELVVALPAEQVAPLVRGVDDTLAALAGDHPSAPCWTVLLGFDRPLEVEPLPGGGSIDRAARNPAKPGRPAGEAWTLHADADWSARHIEAERDAVIAELTTAFAALVPALPRPVHASAHRWRYARSDGARIGHYRARPQHLSACGDWLLAPRVESAWLSGRQAADAILTG
ncbi:NAD(P)-binding protein [Sphingomonas sp. 2R-10]|uniref:NAD(P)/FAD-dependent oxidoreductase n=1 Tax=Sphingomonas sp. 2R-10 TaxID=3045148 RepID=UPI000F767919|nr:FAD-dependent oxidoreductase [Sphingomonas sp. 2R-10]MDJ0275354.1 NAD(P)-binding protein [Sphingomonas sp. 2R-10]